MASLSWNRLHNAQSYEIHGPAYQVDYDAKETSDSYRLRETHGSAERNKVAHAHDLSFVLPSDRNSSRLTLGRPTAKKRYHILDILAAGLSLLCFALAITAVANESISWRLGKGDDQLIVLGLLLSIMSLSLKSVAPTLFLLLEARFGPSTLQKYDGIIRNSVLSSRLSLTWRFVLGLMLALPLGLSAAYKNFKGGESMMKVEPINHIGNASYYGMFAPPGLQSLGEETGISLFFNARLPFAVATSSQDGSEPPLPANTQAYGFNVLLLNSETTAMLDIPQPSYVSAVQELLAEGESWNITASVLGTVATFNDSRAKDPSTYESYFESFCENASESSGAYTHASMMNGWAIELLDHASPGDQSLQYVGITPDPGIDYLPSCSAFSKYAQPYSINRQLCEGTWSITRGGFQLVDGSCNGTILPPEKQMMILNGRWFLGVWFMSSLVEFIGPFATTRNGSEWMGPYMAASMAAISWSRIIAVYGSPSLWEAQEAATGSLANLTYGDVGLIYSVDDAAVYIRPTLRKSGLLYCIFAIQPLLTLIALGLSVLFHSTPVDKGFGLVSILSGIDHKSRDILDGAALSGKLTKGVKLVMHPIKDSQNGTIEYHVALPSTAPSRNGTLATGVIYH